MKTIKTVWKFPIVNGEFTHKIPVGAEFLTLQRWMETPVFWMLVDPKAKKEERKFFLTGTGTDIEVDSNSVLTYLGTFQMQGGSTVFHLFEMTGVAPVLKLLTSKEPPLETDDSKSGNITPTDPKGTNQW